MTSGKSSSPEESHARRSHSSTRRTPRRGKKSCLQKSAVTAAASGFTEGGEDAKSEKMMQNSTITVPSKQTAQ